MTKSRFLQQLKCLPQYLVPHHLLTRFMAYLANIKQPWLKNFGIKFFIRCYKVNMQEALIEDPKAYETFNLFFTRALKTTARPICDQINCIVSPADGTLSQFGLIDHEKLIQAKGHFFNLTDLLGGDQQLAKQFHNGFFATFYLSPKDYHRVHMPLTGQLKKMTYIPGKLFSVSRTATQIIPQLFSRNERLVCLFDTAAGPMVVIFIGAMIVGSIHTHWAGAVTPPHNKPTQSWEYHDTNLIFKTGDELGHFQLGSSVIVIFGKDRVMSDEHLVADQSIKMGEKIAKTKD